MTVIAAESAPLLGNTQPAQQPPAPVNLLNAANDPGDPFGINTGALTQHILSQIPSLAAETTRWQPFNLINAIAQEFTDDDIREQLLQLISFIACVKKTPLQQTPNDFIELQNHYKHRVAILTNIIITLAMAGICFGVAVPEFSTDTLHYATPAPAHDAFAAVVPIIQTTAWIVGAIIWMLASALGMAANNYCYRHFNYANGLTERLVNWFHPNALRSANNLPKYFAPEYLSNGLPPTLSAEDKESRMQARKKAMIIILETYLASLQKKLEARPAAVSINMPALD